MTSSKMDEELRNAAVRGDVDFLKHCVESNKPIEYYLTFYPEEDDQSGRRHHGNIFHMAATENQEEFIREAMGILPQEAMHQLLLQPGDEEYNPLHEAAKVGNVEIVKMFLDVYQQGFRSHLLEHQRPWLFKDSTGNNPCFVAVFSYQEECALEIYKMDTELISNMHSYRGSSLVYEAVRMKMSKLALEILRSPHPISCNVHDGYTPFHSINLIECSEESEEIFRELLEREPELIKQKNKNGCSAFHMWANDGKIWPFKILLDCKDIIQDVNKIFTYLVSLTDDYCGRNPLHMWANDGKNAAPCAEDATKIAELLIDIYKKESPSLSYNQHPWLVKDNFGNTPLSLAIANKYENLAIYLLSVDENVVIESNKNILFLAVMAQCHTVAEEILKIIDNKGWNQLLTNHQKLNILHLAPLCTENFCAQLMERHPELIKGVDKEGSTIVHSWVKSDKEWLFKFILESKWKDQFVKLVNVKDYNYQNSPFHVAATTTHKATNQIVALLVEAYKKYEFAWTVNGINQLPWLVKNKENIGPLHLALLNKREDLGLYILSLLRDDQSMEKLLEYYEPEHFTLFLAIQNSCSEVAKAMLGKLDKRSWTKYLKDSSTGWNILHLATTLTDVSFGTWLVDIAPEFITQKDENGQSPWDRAFELGSAWFIKAVLEKDSSAFSREPLAWTKACEKGHVPALCAFIDHNPGAFRDLCIEKKDSPLHHIKLSSLTDYEEFLKIPRMKDLINLQDSHGVTPLHKAIQDDNLFLTETLLSVDKINYDINDDGDNSAIDLLAQKCADNQAWDRMCKRIGLDPMIKTTYFRTKTNLLDVRNSLFVVAALLATITFTAGFTLPGGFTQDTGEAILAKKAAFLVFLVSNTLALSFSMLVLICLIWSMVFDFSKSLTLIDRSMVFLRLALNFTLLTFMTGVYIVIAPKSLWAAILIIVIVSFLIGISINKDLLYNALEYLDKFPSPSKKCIDRLRLMELGCAPNRVRA
ncbi:uncharacterized protein LOC110720917 [Chenopodium quinoa]|uniref:PGG domain-containing protein n=1 Tax=Chenopodium quinoa TaxID=63459 RepID=A0A803LY20_CHEQI|nr:uncharacterized protein LOC110720917 [Chenopodium quinoa]